ncbi:MAG: transglycosylase domain-containing protein, partial [Treponema sp.]|nr:transglycosylase domain-containing protein [Treponema sp.]
MNKNTVTVKVIFFAAGFAFLAAAFRVVLALVPYPELALYRSRSYGLVIQDRNGMALRVFPAEDGIKREWADLEDIPPEVRRIFIRAEDRRFYFHPGVDLLAIGGSALRNLRAGRIVSGASTITMQLARLIRARGPGLGGKLGETWDALCLEARLSKTEILELWFNGIPFGSNIEGLSAMARARFGIPLERLDDSKAALLAVIPRRPALYDPALDPGAAVRAALSLSHRSGLNLDGDTLWAAAEEAQASGENTSGTDRAPFYAPHFTERIAALPEVRDRARRGEKYESRTGEVRTSLDLPLQLFAEERLQAELRGLRDNRVTNGAVLAIENETGAVRVYAGSASWFDDSISGKIDGVRVRNQPGSCLKPFLYALALDSGFSPADILPDLPSIFGGNEAYIPSNFNRRFNGPVRLRLALASSLNIPAVYLLERLGVRNFEEYLAALGFDSLAASMGTHGTGLALGNAEVSLEELVRGFSAFPRGGSPAVFRWIEGAGFPAGYDTNIVEGGAGRNTAAGVMSPYAAWMIADILSDPGSRFVGFGPAPALAMEFPSMFKTGTANQFQHIWALGSARRFTVGVWMGNFSGETVVGRTGSSIPARIVRDLLAALEGSGACRGNADPEGHPGGPAPASIREVRICALSGMAAGLSCPGTVKEWLPGGGWNPPCTWHRGGEAQFPPEYQAWLTERFRSGRISAGEGGGWIRAPLPGSVYYLDGGLPPEAQALRIETAGFGPGAFVYADGFLQGALNQAGVFVLPLSRGRHTILVEDEKGASAQ